MARYTVLQVVNRILDSINADTSSESQETVEAKQVRSLVTTVYDEVTLNFPWTWLRTKDTAVQPVGGDPNELTLPTNCMMVHKLFYAYNEVSYVSPEILEEIIQSRALAGQGTNGVITDAYPTYYTIYNSTTIVFDSYNVTTLAGLCDLVYQKKPDPVYEYADVLDIPDRVFNSIFYKMLAEAWGTIKRDENRARLYEQKAMQSMANNKRWSRTVVDDYIQDIPNYGRPTV